MTTENKADTLLGFGLLVFAASCILSITGAEFSLALMLAAIIWKAASSRRGLAQAAAEFHANALVFPLALYLLSYIFSSIFSMDSAHSFTRLFTEAIKASSALLLFSAVSRKGPEKAAFWFTTGAAAAALMGVAQFAASLLHQAGGLVRAHGTTHPVTYAEVMALAMLLPLLLAQTTQGRLRKFYAAAFLTIGAGFACSLSRGPAIGLLFSLAIIFSARRDVRKLILTGLALVFIIFAGSAALSESYRARITSMAGSPRQDYTANVRLTMWKAGAAIARDYPLTGTGTYALHKVFNYYHHLPVDGKIDFSDVHNLYIQRTADSGIPGLLALLFLFAMLLRGAYLNFRKTAGPLALWGLAGFAGFMVMMVTDSSFDLPRTSFLIYFMYALSCLPVKPQIPLPD